MIALISSSTNSQIVIDSLFSKINKTQDFVEDVVRRTQIRVSKEEDRGRIQRRWRVLDNPWRVFNNRTLWIEVFSNRILWTIVLALSLWRVFNNGTLWIIVSALSVVMIIGKWAKVRNLFDKTPELVGGLALALLVFIITLFIKPPKPAIDKTNTTSLRDRKNHALPEAKKSRESSPRDSDSRQIWRWPAPYTLAVLPRACSASNIRPTTRAM
jgi:hypothetical protein